MKTNKKILTALAVAMLFTTQGVAAEGFDQSKLHVGAGLGNNSLTGFDNAIGWQFFAGYPLEMVKLGEGVRSSIEVGYMSTTFKQEILFFGTIEASAKGLWATYVANYPVNDQVDALGRIGLDFGDDSGLMFGIGGEYKLDDQKAVRLEYVIRDNVNSLQGNFVYRLK